MIEQMTNEELLGEYVARQNTCSHPELMKSLRAEILRRMGAEK